MADFKYIKSNRITKELDQTVSGKRKMILGFGVPVSVVLLIVDPPLSVIALIGIVVFWVMAGRRDAAKMSGATGEDYTLNELSRLPASYTVFNQVELPDDKSTTGWRELDFIVCGPNGVFVIESKNHRGSLSGSEGDETWTVYKTGRGGTPYSSSIRNPVRQVKVQVVVLKKFLASHKLDPWIEPIVSLSANNDTSRIHTRTVPVVGSARLSAHIQRYKPNRPVNGLMQIIAALRDLELRQAA